MKRWGSVTPEPAWLVCALALVAGVLLRLEAPRYLHIDETVSLLAAACKQRDYARLRADLSMPFVHWVPAGVWQAFLKPGSFTCLGEISRGLSETDMHPPLYFWLLHFWLYLVPASLATGPSLNAPFVLATGVVLFLLARELFATPLVAGLAVVAWAVNPAGLEVTQFARPYELLALFSVLLAWRSARWVHDLPTRERRLRESSILFAVSLGGLLTHYSFIFVAVATGAYLLFALGFKRSLAPGAVIVLGLVATNVFHPTFRQMLFGHHHGGAASARDGAVKALFDRLVAFFAFSCDAAADLRPIHVWIGTAVLSVLAAATVWLAIGRRRTDAARAVDLRFLILPGALVALLAAGMAFGFVPTHATRTRYLAPCWPFFGVLVAYPFALARMTERTARFAVAGGAVALCAAALVSLPEWTNPWPRERAASSDCKRLIVPGSRRTSVLRAVLQLDPQVLVFAGGPADVDDALKREPLADVCLGKGEDRRRVLHVLAKHHVSTSGDGRRERRDRSKSRPADAQDDAGGED